MYLKKLHITNFRCFADYEIEFAPRVTVLFGKNGSGKTTLIHAIHKALSFAFKRDNGKEAFNLGAGFPELKPQNFNKEKDLIRNPKSGLPFPFINIAAEASCNGNTLQWEMFAQTTTFKLQQSKFSEASKKLKSSVQETNQFPLLDYFSDGFPHVEGKRKPLSKTEMSLRNLGYLGWDKETEYSDLWIERLTKTWTLWDRANREVGREEAALRNCEISDEEYRALHIDLLANAKIKRDRYEPEVNAIKNCLSALSKNDPNYEVTDIFVSLYEESGLCLATRNGKNPSFTRLPAGYKRLFYMALDIAYRSFLLSNGESTDIPGIVIIDEIDLHLHPELEKIVLQRFVKTFPNVQFIVSTHSPLVLTSLSTADGNNSIMRMEPRQIDEPEALGQKSPILRNDIYGLDYNSSVQEGMDVSSGDEDLEWGISECAFMIKQGLNEQVEILKKQILDLKLISSDELDKRIEERLNK